MEIGGKMVEAELIYEDIVLHPANGTADDEAECRRSIDEVLGEVLRVKRAKVSLSKIVVESRR